MEEDGVLGPRRIRQGTDFHLDARRAESVPAPSGDRIGIHHGGDNPPHTRAEDEVRARRLLPLMGAGLESDNQRRPSSPFPSRRQGQSLGVALTKFGVPALSDRLAAGKHNSTNERVRLYPPPPSPGEVEGSGHGLPLVHLSA